MSLKQHNWGTGSRASRGYGPAWDKLRKVVLARDGHLCQCAECRAEGRVSVATHVDHIKPKAQGGTDALENLQAINAKCHERKTLTEQGKTQRERYVIGPDGYPVRNVRPGG